MSAAYDALTSRLRSEPTFARQLLDDPSGCLDEYELTTDELRRLADQLTRPLDTRAERRARAGFFRLLAEQEGHP